jgi:hypothetical protein
MAAWSAADAGPTWAQSVATEGGAEAWQENCTTRIDAMGNEVPHCAPFLAECAELNPLPYCDSDAECPSDTICFWHRCLNEDQWERLRSTRCLELEVQLDYGGVSPEDLYYYRFLLFPPLDTERLGQWEPERYALHNPLRPDCSRSDCRVERPIALAGRTLLIASWG